MNKQEFEDAVLAAAKADPHDGGKWDRLESLFHSEGLRGAGAISNNPADRRTRVRQLFTAKAHAGFVDVDRAKHGVLVFGADAAARIAEDPSQLKEYVVPTVVQERQGLPVQTTLILRYDASARRNQLVPLALVNAGASQMMTYYREWYNAIPVFDLPATIGGRPSILTLAEGELPLPSSADTPLVGLDESFERAVAALRAGKNVILLGPPGTGKTVLAEYICHTLIESPPDHFSYTTATADWTSFDTIGGYLPVVSTSKEITTALEFTSGVITAALESSRWLIIDEINRADIDKAFGELFTLLSGKSVRLPFKKLVDGQLRQVVLGASISEQEYAIDMATNWRLLGTMNSFDKASLFQLSFAFMRRFAFVDVPIPDDRDYNQLLDQATTDTGLSKETVKVLASLFVPKAGEDFDKLGLRVGPAVPLDIIRYCDERVRGGAKLAQGEIVAEALEMYFFPQLEGQDKKHRKILDAIRGALDIDDATKRHLDRKLSIWTGFEKGTAV